MARTTRNWFSNKIGTRLVITLFAFTTMATLLAGTIAGQEAETGPPRVGEGSLLFRSPIAGRYESVPLLHTDVTIDVRGLVAAATVTQQYENSSSAPIEAVYVFPLPHDA